MAMTALALSSVTQKSRWYYPVMLLGMVGAGLFFGDGVITPAISVLSAIEGLEVAAPALKPYVIPVTLAVLVALYLLQRRGTAGIGKWFGPIVLVWFITLAAMGVANIAKNPVILIAFNPHHALGFLIHNGWFAFVALGAVVLALTGAEALYADMGHLARRQFAWPGSLSSLPRWHSITSGKAPCCYRIRQRFRILSFCNLALGASIRS
jgi:KUP system potassium uptake protein